MADVFDALGSDRVYKRAWPLTKIIALFQKGKGNYFDPDLVDFLFANLEQFQEFKTRFSDTKAREKCGACPLGKIIAGKPLQSLPIAPSAHMVW